MSGSVGVASQLDVETEFRQDVGPSSGSEMDLSAEPTQSPHPLSGLGMVPSSVSGYHDISSMASTSGFHRMTASDDVTPGIQATSATPQQRRSLPDNPEILQYIARSAT